MNLIVFYGANAKLAREMGVPVFRDGDTGEVVITPQRCDGGKSDTDQDLSYPTVAHVHFAREITP